MQDLKFRLISVLKNDLYLYLDKPERGFGLQERDGNFIKFEFKQTKVLTNKFGLFATILVCLSEFWFVCKNFGLFVKHFGLFV